MSELVREVSESRWGLYGEMVRISERRTYGVSILMGNVKTVLRPR